MTLRLRSTASAVPRYHSATRPRAMYGWSSLTPPRLRSRSHGRPRPMWSLSERGLYWVRTTTLSMSELTQFDSVKSMIRYLPPNGTAGLARSCDRIDSRSPSPPARMTAIVRFIGPPPLWNLTRLFADASTLRSERSTPHVRVVNIRVRDRAERGTGYRNRRGLTKFPLYMTAQWRCAPVECPVLPS